MRTSSTALLALAAALLAAPSHAISSAYLKGKSPEEAGDLIIDYAEGYHAGWKSSQAKARLYLFDERGKRTYRNLEIFAVERAAENDAGQSFIIYDHLGTGLFTSMLRYEPDQQWLWVSGLKRRRRLNSSGVGGAFVGSEFAYEDFRSQYPGKFENRLLGHDSVDGFRVWVLRRIPKDRDSGYSQLVVYLDKEHARVVKTEFFDKADRPLKTLTNTQWEKRDGKFWRAMHSRMENLQTKRVSEWVTESIKLDAGFSDLRKRLR